MSASQGFLRRIRKYGIIDMTRDYSDVNHSHPKSQPHPPAYISPDPYLGSETSLLTTPFAWRRYYDLVKVKSVNCFFEK
ncbi:MAG TPA: hypothetical protein DIW81_11740 [Planctomycetaceae bacterium]|nr:hypothetical protein [Planctomycetaceae bacterium]